MFTITISSMPNVFTVVSFRDYINKGYLNGEKLTCRWFESEESFKGFFRQFEQLNLSSCPPSVDFPVL